jgi:hypothetical protein
MPEDHSREGVDPRRLNRRQVMSRAGAVATVGVAAWVVPEILVAKPGVAGAAGLSGTPGGTTGNTGGGGATTSGAVTDPTGSTSAAETTDVATTADKLTATGETAVTADATTSGSLASTGLDIQREVELGAALIAGGWALHHWSSRDRARVAREGPSRPLGAIRPDDAD